MHAVQPSMEDQLTLASTYIGQRLFRWPGVVAPPVASQYPVLINLEAPVGSVPERQNHFQNLFLEVTP